MRLVCPCCGAVASLEAWAEDPHIRDALAIAFRLPEAVGRLCPAYLALFRPGGRGLQWQKMHRLIRELADLVSAPYIQAGSRAPARPCTPALWGEALSRITAHPPRQLPLKNHNYLARIAWDLADTADREAETRRNQAERNGSWCQDRDQRQGPPPEMMSPEEMRRIRRENMQTRPLPKPKTDR